MIVVCEVFGVVHRAILRPVKSGRKQSTRARTLLPRQRRIPRSRKHCNSLARKRPPERER